MNNLSSYLRYCDNLRDTRKLRELLVQRSSFNKKCINFSSNDYLLLSRSDDLLKAAQDFGVLYGVGSTGSRLLSGNSKSFTDFEMQIAKDKHTEAALIFNSGYQANLSIIASLCDSKVLGQQALVFFDKLNHASLYQGIFLCGAKLIRYAHNNMEDLHQLLQQYNNDPRPKFIVSETLFGMDGDIVNLPALVDFASEYNALLYLDEAHSTGILGEYGYGLSTTLDMSRISYVVMGTFSKAMGVCGAYVACSHQIRDYLVNKCIGFIYSTSLSPMVIGAATKAWQLIKDLHQERKELLEKADILRNNLKKSGLDIGQSSTHIIPIILKKEGIVLNLQQKLLEYSILVSAIRSPTVPPGSARIRIALNIGHNDCEISALTNCLKSLL
ncbi:MAG: aminotransferase class I/II-fold pyridoxal phosphate-dependent enzyme [Janthinobacterium lividum]